MVHGAPVSAGASEDYSPAWHQFADECASIGFIAPDWALFGTNEMPSKRIIDPGKLA
jgi:hypothetical protein